MMDAIASGCVPFAPCRLAYPEYIPERNLYAPADTPEQEGVNLATHLLDYAKDPSKWNPVDVSTHSESALWYSIPYGVGDSGPLTLFLHQQCN